MMGAKRSAEMAEAVRLVKAEGMKVATAARQAGISMQALWRDPELRAHRGMAPYVSHYRRQKPKGE
jgi:predicted DNA-binding protein (UPF0251 family)